MPCREKMNRIRSLSLNRLTLPKPIGRVGQSGGGTTPWFGLRTKLVIVFTLLFTGIILTISFLTIGQQERLLIKEMKKRGRLSASNLAMSARDAVLEHDLLTLNALIGALQKDRDVVRTYIVDPRGVILMHSDVTKLAAAVPVRETDHPTENNAESRIGDPESSSLIRISEPIRYGDKILGEVHLSLSPSGIHAVIRRVKLQLIAIAGLGLVLGMTGILLLSHIFLQPVAALSKATKEVADGNLDISVPVKNRDEVGVLGTSFNIMVGRLKSAYEQVERGHLQTTFALAAAVEAKDPTTRGHCGRVCGYALVLGESIGLSRIDLKELELAAILHDIGKIGVKDGILTKPGRLTLDERRQVRLHPEIGHQIMEKVEPLHKIAKYTLHHHEFYTGQGYPWGLKGEEIPLISRIITVVDSYDSMSSRRPYRKALPEDVVLHRIVAARGLQFDPFLVDRFLELCRAGTIEKVRRRYDDPA
jgi:HD-GYP domain-containing protein (c-di-GMP phosphodiesterase class II)